MEDWQTMGRSLPSPPFSGRSGFKCWNAKQAEAEEAVMEKQVSRYATQQNKNFQT
jgi:hypothetical protein